jgi:phage gp45-like
MLLLRRSGDRSRSIAIGTNHRPSRLKDLKPGDSALYDVRGAKITLTEDGLLIDCAGLPATIKNATTVRIEADTLECTGDIVSRADGTPVSLNDLRDAYHAHKHGGVQTGSGTTGTTDHDA